MKLLELVFVRILFHQCLKIDNSVSILKFLVFTFKFSLVLHVLQRDLLLRVYLLMASSVLFLALHILKSYIKTISYMIFLMHCDFEVKKTQWHSLLKHSMNNTSRHFYYFGGAYQYEYIIIVKRK